MDDNLNVTSVAYAITERPSCISYFVPKTGDVYRIFFVLCYLVMLTIGTIENVGALVYLIRHRYRNHGSKILLINLTVANLIVADIIIPIEILWRVSYVWPTGPVGCKVLQYFRALGHYSTSMMLVAISVDRYIILTNPFCQHSTRNVRMMVLVAWLTAILFSIPQSFVFSLKRHPRCHEFIQCVPYNYFTLPWGLSAYNIISLVAVYFVPLIIMISCYGIILRRIWKEGNEFTNITAQGTGGNSEGDSVNRGSLIMSRLFTSRDGTSGTEIVSMMTNRRREAYVKTIKKAIIIVLAFIICWTPFVFVVFMKEVSPSLLRNLNNHLGDFFLIFALTNCCINPIIYGTNSSLSILVFKKLCVRTT